MLNKGVKGELAEGSTEEGEMFRKLNQGGDSQTMSLLYGGGAAFINSGSAPWTAAYIDTIGEPTADLRSNIAAEARAKIVYERLINVTKDPGVKEALGFLMTREIAHQKSFEKALYSIEPNFPPGKLPGVPEFTNKYYNMSQGEGDMRGPWNQGEQTDGDWEYISDREQQCAVDGGDGKASVKLSVKQDAAENAVAERLASRPGNPVTGTDLGSAPTTRQ